MKIKKDLCSWKNEYNTHHYTILLTSTPFRYINSMLAHYTVKDDLELVKSIPEPLRCP